MNDPAAYGDRCAEFYDEIYPSPSRAALQRLVELARGGPVLDAGCGTGRYLLALARLGLPVHGIEASEAMIERLRAKPGGDAIGVTHGDFSRVDAPGRFRLVACLASTLALLPDRQCQAHAVRRLAAALDDDGALLLETSTLCNSDNGRHTDVSLDTRLGPRRYAVRLCPIDIGELDAWAASAGLHLHARWSNWQAAPWRSGADNTLSIFRRPRLA